MFHYIYDICIYTTYITYIYIYIHITYDILCTTDEYIICYKTYDLLCSTHVLYYMLQVILSLPVEGKARCWDISAFEEISRFCAIKRARAQPFLCSALFDCNQGSWYSSDPFPLNPKP